jgi:hypothetical protein
VSCFFLNVPWYYHKGSRFASSEGAKGSIYWVEIVSSRVLVLLLLGRSSITHDRHESWWKGQCTAMQRQEASPT